MKKIQFIIFFIVLLLLIGCSAGELLTRNYYILEYYEHTEKEELKQTESDDASVFVLDAEIPRSYQRKQLVVRHFGPRITYNDYDQWGVDLSESIPNLLATRLNNYNIFKRAQREYWNNKPEYEIMTNVNNLELNKSASVYQARLNISFTLKESGSEIHLVNYSVNAEKVLLANDMDTYVQTINEMILEQADQFIQQILVFQNKIETKEKDKDNLDENLDSSMAKIDDEKEISSGKGLLLLPALSDTDNEPYYSIVDKYGYERSAKVGEVVPLMEGLYDIYYGSGDEIQKIKKDKVEIISRYKTIIEPDWGCLVIDIIDENRNFAKVRYEIFELKDGESFGSEFPAEEEVGEQEKIWMLRPGLYKITVNNEPFNTYRDFTTVKVENGILRKLTIVMDTDDDDNPTNMVGAGILDVDNLAASMEVFKINSAIHGNINFNSDNEIEKDKQEYTLTMNGQLENYLLYDEGPIHYTMKNLMEIGISKETDTDFHLATDDFDLKNTGIYYFLEDLGFYGRFDVNSHFFINRYLDEEGFNLTKINALGDTLITSQFVKEFDVKPNFLPLIMKEGLGINYRILNYAKANLSIRGGLGFRQEFYDGVYALQSSNNSGNIEERIYREMDSITKTGTEFSLVGNFKLPFELSYSTNADILIPFEKDEEYTIEWENIFNLKLFKYISLDYKLKLENKQQASDEYILTKHSLFLRLTYFLK